MDTAAEEPVLNILPTILSKCIPWIAKYGKYSIDVFRYINPAQIMMATFFRYLVTGNDTDAVAFLSLMGKVPQTASSYIGVWLRDDFDFIRQDVAEALSTLARIVVSEKISVHSPLVSSVTCLDEKYSLFRFFTQYASAWSKFIGKSTRELIPRPLEYDVDENDAVIASLVRSNIGSLFVDEHSLLHYALCTDFVEAALALYEGGATFLRVNDEESKLFNEALELDDPVIIKILAKFDADLLLQEKNGFNLLHIAAEKGKTAVVELLLYEGLDIESQTNSFMTPLHCASSEGHLSTVELLIRKGAKINVGRQNNQTPLHLAVIMGHANVVAALCAAGGRANRPAINLRTILHDAVQHGCPSMVAELIAAGAKTNAIESFGNKTPLHEAIENKKTGIVEVLLAARKTKVDIRDHDDKTCLHIAAESGYIEGVKALIAAGADVNAKDKHWKKIPLHLAAENGHAEVVAALCANGADVNCSDKFGNTPLSLARRGCKVEAAKILLSNGAVN